MTAAVAYGERFIVPLVNEFMANTRNCVSISTVNRTLDLVQEGYDLASASANSASRAEFATASRRAQCTCALHRATWNATDGHTLPERRDTTIARRHLVVQIEGREQR